MRKLRAGIAVTALASIAALVPAPAYALETNDELVQSWYVHFLQRSPADAARDYGREHWVQLLDAGAQREQVLGAIVRGPEYVQRQVGDSYRAILGRAPDPGAAHWVEAAAQREGALEWVDQNLLASRELHDRWASRPDRDDLYVQQLYVHVLGRYAWQTTPGERAYWAGRVRAVGRLEAVRELWYSDEAVRHRLHQHYRSLLGLADVDRYGLHYWYPREKEDDLRTQVEIASTARYHARANQLPTLTYLGQVSVDAPDRALFVVTVGDDSRTVDLAVDGGFGLQEPLSSVRLVSQAPDRRSAVVELRGAPFTLQVGRASLLQP